MQDEWVNYRDKVYPQGIEGVQNTETHQAFFAGALRAIVIMTRLSLLPEEDANRSLEKLQREIYEICQARADTLKARN